MSDTPSRPYRGLSAEERVEDRRRRLLSAGRDYFAEAGDAAPWVGSVCARAGVSKKHFYDLFDDRLDLVRALHTEAVDWFSRGFDDEGDEADPLAWLERIVPSLFARLLEDVPRARVLALAPVHLAQGQRTVADMVVDGLVERVRHVPDRPRASSERIRRHATGAVHAGRALLQEWLLARGGPDRGPAMAQYVRDVVSVASAALSPVLP